MEIVDPSEEIKKVVDITTDFEKEKIEKFKADNIKDIQTHKKMLKLYKESPIIMKLIKDSFKTLKGVRPIAIQKRFPRFIQPLVWYPKVSNQMLNIGKFNLELLEKNYGQIHFFETIFDEKILDEELINKEILEARKIHEEVYENKGVAPIRAMVYNTHIIGITYVFDIDAPVMGENGENGDKRKVDCFEIWDRFMFIKTKIEWYLDGLGLKYKCIFSGNGIYVVVEECYFKSVDRYVEFIREMQKIVFHINNWIDQYYKYKGPYPRIDDKGKSWWNYVKTIFTYDTKTDRLTFP